MQRRIRPTKVGHCGTLDPLAQGVLVLGVGPAVRLTSYVQASKKRYIASFRLGASSETGDLEQGYVEHHELPVPTSEQLERAAQSLIGKVEQIPPAYSAIWVDGKRAYQRARNGEQVEMPRRIVSIDQVDVLCYQYPDVRLDIVCGSGTYIRSLGIDLAKAVGSISVMTELTRVGIGPFTLEASVSIEQLRDQPLEPLILPASLGVTYLPRVVVDDDDSIRLGHGLPLAGESALCIDESVNEAVAVTARGTYARSLCPSHEAGVRSRYSRRLSGNRWRKLPACDEWRKLPACDSPIPQAGSLRHVLRTSLNG